MKLSDTDLETLTALAVTAAERAAEHIQNEAGRDREVLSKAGGSSLASQVVTEVDFESQRLILDTLRGSFTNDELGLLTEERSDDGSRFANDHFWCIDPLDGTLPFTENVPGYSVSIALVSREGIPQLGVIADPTTGSTYHARRGGGAFKNGAALTLEPRDDGELTLVMDRSFAEQPGYADLFAQIESIATSRGLDGVRTINQGGAAMNAMWVIENAPALYFKPPKPKPGGGSLWDFAASACLFAELGCPASDINSHPLQLNRKDSTFMNKDGVLYASDSALAEAVVERFGRRD